MCRFAMICCLVWLLVGCQPGVVPAQPTPSIPSIPITLPPTPLVTPFITTTPTNIAVPTIFPTQTPIPIPPTASPTHLPLSSVPTTLPEVENWIISNWIADFDPATIQQALQAAGWQTDHSQLQAYDLTGDGRVEWLLTLFIPVSGSPSYVSPGQFWIVNEQGIAYRTIEDPTGFEEAAQIVTVADFTGDGQYEVVIQKTACGAHTCYQSYFILGVQAGKIVNLILNPQTFGEEANSIYISYSDASTTDVTGDGVYDFLVHGGTIGSAGAGIHRGYTETWAWNGQNIVLVSTVWDTTNYRHHLLYDANNAFDADLDQLAADLYQRVIYDESLTDVPAWDSNGDTRADSRQFATFRLALLALRQNDLPTATEWDSSLRLSDPEDPLTEAINLLIQTWQSNGHNLAAACTVVTDYLSPLPNATGTLAYLGYGNPPLTAETVCPIQDDSVGRRFLLAPHVEMTGFVEITDWIGQLQFFVKSII